MMQIDTELGTSTTGSLAIDVLQNGNIYLRNHIVQDGAWHTYPMIRMYWNYASEDC